MPNFLSGVLAMLNEIETLPESLLEARVEDLHDLLGGPTLIHLPGRQSEPLFLSVLLHGNEDAGFLAVQALLRAYEPKELPRALSLFIGNVSAARAGQRSLDGQPDYNRIWPGTVCPELPEARMMQRLVDSMRARRVFASIDVHNNTGINPHYACINRIENRFLNLAAQFSRTVVYFIRPLGVQSMAMSEVCPALTIECGKPGQEYGVEHARDFLDACLHLHEIPSHPVSSHDVDLYHTVATVKIPEQISFGFEEGDVDLILVEGLDHLNFRELPAHTVLGRVRDGTATRLNVSDEHGEDVYDRYFRIERETLLTNCPLMPSMFTLDEKIIRQDCLGYLMERLLPETAC
jgi:Succinylglutamate desuccinylase / Aspartoacylase family